MTIEFEKRTPPPCPYQLTKWLRRDSETASVVESLIAAGLPYELRRLRNGMVAVFVQAEPKPEPTPRVPLVRRAAPRDNAVTCATPPAPVDPYTFRLTGWGALHNRGAVERDLTALRIPYNTREKPGNHNTMRAIYISPDDVWRIEEAGAEYWQLVKHLNRRRKEAAKGTTR